MEFEIVPYSLSSWKTSCTKNYQIAVILYKRVNFFPGNQDYKHRRLIDTNTYRAD